MSSSLSIAIIAANVSYQEGELHEEAVRDYEAILKMDKSRGTSCNVLSNLLPSRCMNNCNPSCFSSHGGM